MKKRLLTVFLSLFSITALFSQALYVNPIQNNDTSRLIFGGYGEILYQRMDYGPNPWLTGGSEPDKRAIVDLPRMIVSFDYKFGKGWGVSTEVEFEHGGTGSTFEYEYEESGEWEMEIEKGGEVVLEQFYISKYFSDAFAVKVGHFVVPVGLTNQNHLPTQFFGTVRPEGEITIIPLTWHETGIALVGRFGRRRTWSYEAQLINGLDANGMSSQYWVRKARQTQYENVKMTDMAVALRIDNRSIRNLKLGASFYRGNTTANSSKPDKMEHIDGTVTIGTLDAVFNNRNFIFRGNCLYGSLADSDEISELNKKILSRNSPYTNTPVAKSAMSYSAEMGYNIFKLLNIEGQLYPFVRYEYYNSMETVEESVFQDPRFDRTVTTFGINYFPIKNLAIKADYSMRKIDGGNYNDENTFGLAIGYYGIFSKM